MVLLTTKPPYRIERTSMRNLIFGAATKRLHWPAAVQECATQAMLPVNAGQMWAFRLEADGTDHADDYFMTSTASIYFLANGKPSVAFYDAQHLDGGDNLLITRATEGATAYSTDGRWLVDMNDKTLTAMLQHAEQRDRIITPDARTLSLDSAPHRITSAILGDHLLAHDVQAWLCAAGYKTAEPWIMTEQEMRKQGVDAEHAAVRRVGMITKHDSIDYHCSLDLYLDIGRARGARNTSVKNKGDC